MVMHMLARQALVLGGGLALAGSAPGPPRTAGLQTAADCPLLALAAEFSTDLLDTAFHRRRGAATHVFDGLQLSTCNGTLGERTPLLASPSPPPPHAAAVEFVVATDGSDSSGAGTLAAPYRTLARARAEVLASSQRPATVWVRGGTYYLDAPLVLGPEDSNTTYAAWQDELPVLSGGQRLEMLDGL